MRLITASTKATNFISTRSHQSTAVVTTNSKTTIVWRTLLLLLSNTGTNRRSFVTSFSPSLVLQDRNHHHQQQQQQHTQQQRKFYPFQTNFGFDNNFGTKKSIYKMSSSQVEVEQSSSPSSSSSKYYFIDIGANLLAEQFTEGEYFGKKRHEPDWDEVLSRAYSTGVTHIVLTAGTLNESRRALELVRTLRAKNNDNDNDNHSKIQFGCTIGVHPTRCTQEFVNYDKDKYTSSNDILQELVALVKDGIQDQSVVSIGEIGLDYDRLEFCSKEIQQEFLQKQLDIFLPNDNKKNTDGEEEKINNNDSTRLPLFLHNRSVGTDLLKVLQTKQEQLKPTSTQLKGVVHSFDDTIELANEFIKCGFYIGLNGCSLKTKDNLDVIKEIPLESILLETDCPYCEIKPTHASYEFVTSKKLYDKKPDKKFELGKMVKGRNEPCQIIQVAEVIANIKGISLSEVAKICYENSLNLYGWSS